MKLRFKISLFIILTSFANNSFSQNLVPVTEIDKNTKIKRWGFSDRFYTEAVIKCQYDSSMAFTEGLGRVRIKSKYGFVDKTGKLVIPAKYDAAMEFNEGFSAVFLDGKSFFIDKKGIDVFKKTFKTVSSFSYGVAMCAGEDGKRGFIDTKGNIVVPLTLEAAFPFGDRLTAVRFSGEKVWKAINTKGEVVFTFNEKVKSVMGSFSDGMAIVYVDGPAGYNVHYDFVNEKGEFVCDAPYASAKPFKKGRAIIAYENKNRKSSDLQYYKYGLIKKDGREIVPAKYACLEESIIPGIYFYGSKSETMKSCTGYGLLDSNGKEITRPIYSNFNLLNDTTFLCKEADQSLLKQYLLLTTNGKELLKLKKKNVEYSILGNDTIVVLWSQTFNNDLLISLYHTKKGLLKENINGYITFKKQKLILIPDWQYTNGILLTSDGQVVLDKIQTHEFRRDTLLKADIPFILISSDTRKDFKMYNLDTRKIMINDFGFKNEGNPYYSGQFSEGLLPVKQKSKWGFMDITGKIKLPAIYESAENFHEGWAVVGKKDKAGKEYEVYIDKASKEMPGIKADPLNASEFNEGFAFYCKGYAEPIRYINKTGKEIFKSESDKYFDHGKFTNGLAAVPNKQGKYGYINTQGELVIPYQYTIPKTQYSTVNSIAFNTYGTANVALDGKNITISKPKN